MKSLHTLLEPPEGQLGEFAWICGYSADAAALDRIAEGFTRFMRSQRAHEGRTWIGLILDRGNPWISPGACPGVAHLRMQSQPWRLLHAKLALASFVGPDDTWTLRLVVGTGNWTRQTLEDSLDLAWSLQVDHTDVAGPDHKARAAFRDLLAAADVLDTLRQHADLGLLGPDLGPVADLSRAAMLGLDNKVSCLRSVAGKGATRLIDNRKRSLKKEILRKLKALNAKPLNTLVMGSGFYESEVKGLPSVPLGLVDDLREAGRLTRSATVHLVAQPDACQGLAAAITSPAWRRSGWNAWPPSDPMAGSGTPRRLHAKFVLAASHRKGSDNMGSAWLYLGSGNLTGPGLSRRASRQGNLEVGVVFAPNILWSEVADHLPIDAKQPALTPSTTQAGDCLPAREPGWVPPIPYVQIHARDVGLLLCPPESADVELLGLDGEPCDWSDSGWIWLWATPLDVEIRAEDGQARVPVLDATGRVGGGPLIPLEFDEALPLLQSFPDPPEADELGDDDGQDQSIETSPGFAAGQLLARKRGRDASPVRQMTSLLETIAVLQCSLSPTAWLAWTVRLEQTLVRVADSPVVEAFRELELDPLPVLTRPAFLPPQALESETLESYAALLKRVREAWGVDDLAPLIPEAQ